MRISTNWIKDYVNIDCSLEELAKKVTDAGVNIETIETSYISNLVIGNIVKVDKHPNSDHLNICLVNVGSEELVIVCGASNVRPGLNVIVALEGANLPGDFIIKKSKIRDVESNGMICALYELGLEENNEENYNKGIHEIEEEVEVGSDANLYLGLSDTIYNLDLNPNRNDCLSHLGFSYEVASVLGTKVKMPEVEVDAISKDKDFTLEVKTDNVPLYTCQIVEDVVIKESPNFIKERLIAAGMRPINNVVDISNYIMLEYGQPLHFFDYDKVGNKILVRMANKDEKIITLDKKERVLSSNDIVITDGTKPICIAGVMGGLNSDVDSNTKNIIVESAIFNPYNIRYTSLNLDLRSEASLRLEKPLNSDYTHLALQRACYLLNKYASGKVVSKKYISDNLNEEDKIATVSKTQVNNLLGMNLSIEDISLSLDKLDFEYKLEGEVFTVNIPKRRMDIEAHYSDLVEEIGRLYGYDKIPNTMPVLEVKKGEYSSELKFKKDLSKYLRSLNLNETRTYTLISEEESKLFTNTGKNIRLLRPLSSDKNVIRQSIISGLIKVVDYNKARNVNDINIYEIANVYYDDIEESKVGICLSGNYMNNNWLKTTIKNDFYLAKGIVESILNYLGLNNRYYFKKEEFNSIHPGISAGIYVDNKLVGYIGKVHPNVSKTDIYVIELSITKLFQTKVSKVKYKEVSKYPSVTKDLAFVMDKNISSSEIENVIKRSAGKNLRYIDVFDVYTGNNIESHLKSIAYTLTFNDSTKTLTDEEINNTLNKIIESVESKTSAKLRK